MKKISIILLGFFVVVWGFTAANAEEGHVGHHDEPMMHSAEGMAVGAAAQPVTEEMSNTYYTCPMHPEVHSDEPGNCPQCGMALEKKTETIVDANNEICPVSDEPISGKHFALYNGKRYGFCCDMCIRKFKKKPEKYIKVLEKSQESQKGAESEHPEGSHH